MEPFILIGAPVYKRAWMLPTYFEYIERQSWPMGQLGFIFEAAPNDEETMEELMAFAQKYPELRCFDVHINTNDIHREHPEGQRVWNREHYRNMANMRNYLLAKAQCYNPDKYFSLDTDIILQDPDTIKKLYELDKDIVSPLMYMTPNNIEFPSIMTWGLNGRGYRDTKYPLGTVFKADIVMAAVMMSHHVIRSVQYEWHIQGEDLGFAMAAANKGFSLFAASNIYCPHIMSRAELKTYLDTGDPREILLKEKLLVS